MTRIPLSAVDEKAKELTERLEMSTAEIGLSVRTTNCLEERGIFTVHDLLQCTREDLLSISNFGEKTLEEVYKALEGEHNPQIYPHYKIPDSEPEIGHMREYTAYELGQAVKAAGFEIERLFTTVIEEYAGPWRAILLDLLEERGYSVEDRGEQTWCLAKKRSSLPVDRFPRVVFGP